MCFIWVYKIGGANSALHPLFSLGQTHSHTLFKDMLQPVVYPMASRVPPYLLRNVFRRKYGNRVEPIPPFFKLVPWPYPVAVFLCIPTVVFAIEADGP